MSTITSLSLDTRSSLLRSIALGGLFIFIVQLVHIWIVASLIQGSPFITVLQYFASGVLGESAFMGGAATAVLGVLFHLIVSLAIAAVFIVSADQNSLLRRYAIAGSLLYGLGVYIVMNFVVLPLSAAPPLPVPAIPWLIEAMLEHILLVGLPLGILVRRNLNRKI